eukprot:4221313-Pleurochrysis_carterae.AAC.1
MACPNHGHEGRISNVVLVAWSSVEQSLEMNINQSVHHMRVCEFVCTLRVRQSARNGSAYA